MHKTMSARQFAKNTIVLFISQIVTYLMGFFITMYTARYLGTEGFGILNTALSITAIIVVFTDLGISSLTVREVARNKDLIEKFLPNTFIIKIILSVMTFGMVILIANILGYPELVKTVIYIITISTLINAIGGIFSVYFQAYEKMEYLSVNSILNSSIMLIGTYFGIYYNLDLLFFAYLYVIANIISFIYIIIVYFTNFCLPKFDIDFNFWKITIKEAIFFGLSSIFVSLYFYIDSVMLSVMVGSGAVGIYNAAYKLIFVLMFIPNVVIIALFPIMSRHFDSAKNLLKLEYEKLFKYLFAIAIFILLDGIIFADNIIQLIYGANFIESVLVLQLLIIVVPIIFITSLFGNLLGAINKQRFVTIVAGANIILNIILNLILIPKLSYVGSSIATVLTELLGFILMFMYISKYFFKISIKQNLLKTIIIGLLSYGIVYYLKIEFNWILACIASALIYLIFLYVFKIITEDDIELLKDIL